MHAGECLLQECVRTLDFFVRESCGRCTPCRVGTVVLRDLCSGLAEGHNGSAVNTKIAEVDG